MCVEKGYALHLGDDSEYRNTGVEIKSSSKEVFNSSDLTRKLIAPRIKKLTF